jgi:hypothetical protein
MGDVDIISLLKGEAEDNYVYLQADYDKTLKELDRIDEHWYEHWFC